MSIETASERKEKALYDAVRHSNVRPGQKLPNGAIILMHTPFVKNHDQASEAYVLALAEGEFQPFVVWRRTVGTESRADGSYGKVDYCWSGDYHRTLHNAVSAFEKI